MTIRMRASVYIQINISEIYALLSRIMKSRRSECDSCKGGIEYE